MIEPIVDERRIDHALAAWVRERTGSDLLARAAFAVSQAEGQGHVCAVLLDEATFAAAEIAGLRTHAWVGAGDGFTPFVLDSQVHLYTWRNWQHETRLAAGLRALASARTLPLASEDLVAGVDDLFDGQDTQATQWQRVAVAAAPGSRLFVLTGGPGTGKTATVLRLLLMLLRHASSCGLPAQPVIALAAPTGKAAQRLAHTIAKGRQQLREQLATTSTFRGVLETMANDEPQTLHRLLGFRPRQNAFARGARDPLAADIVVIDEASMVDLAMMRQLVEALRPQAVLILLGDPGQLAAVEAGSVLSDIVAGAAQNQLPAALTQRLAPILPSPAVASATSLLAGQVITLTHVWRAGSGLQRGIQAMRVGDERWLDGLLVQGSEGNLRLHECADAAALRGRVDAWIESHHALFDQLMTPVSTTPGSLTPGIAPEAALTCLRSGQILCALREGAFGAQGINALVARRLAARLPGFDATQAWYHGRPVLITRNDYARDLFNGDIGITLQGDDGLRVWFEVNGGDGHSGVRSFSPRALPTHETAWAITIHRSQGSEYNDVAIVLPPDPQHRVLTRELLYTAVSRATDSAEIWTTSAALRAAVANSVQRRGGLRGRLL